MQTQGGWASMAPTETREKKEGGLKPPLQAGDWEGDALLEAALVPVGICWREMAGGVQFGSLFGGGFPADGGEILAGLFFVASAENYAGDGGAAQDPIEGDLGNALAGFLGDGVDRVHDFVDIFVGDRWAVFGGFVEAAFRGKRVAAANFSGEAAPAERAPDEGANFLIDGEGHEFEFVIAADEGVVDLMGDVAGPAVAFGDGERLHQVPAGKIGAGDVANFAAANE